MKKTIVRLMVVMVLVLFPLFAYADTEDIYVYDDAGLLTASQVTELERKASFIAENYQCAVYVVTVDDYTQYGTGDVLDVAEDIYMSMEFGYGEEQTGLMLLLSMEERDYALIAYGDFAHQSFTDYGKDVLSDYFLDDFRYDDWYTGFSDYYDQAELMLNYSAAGEPVDDPYAKPSGGGLVQPQKKTLMDYIERYLIMLFPGAAISLGGCSISRSSMKTVHTAKNADRYVSGRLALRSHQDQFIHRTQSRRMIPRNTDTMGGGHSGGTTIRPSGFSGKSGKF